VESTFDIAAQHNDEADSDQACSFRIRASHSSSSTPEDEHRRNASGGGELQTNIPLALNEQDSQLEVELNTSYATTPHAHGAAPRRERFKRQCRTWFDAWASGGVSSMRCQYVQSRGTS
jgi:hypothetical protein